MSNTNDSERNLSLKLLIPNLLGGHIQEYIPKNYSELSKKIKYRYIKLRMSRGWQIYYWQIRFLFRPKDRKIYDINFMLHCIEEHEGVPPIFLERLHYKLAKRLYKHELDFIKLLHEADWLLDGVKDVYVQKDKYAKAYYEKWINNFDESPEWRIVYHGVNIAELGYYFDVLFKKEDYRTEIFDAALKKAEELEKRINKVSRKN